MSQNGIAVDPHLTVTLWGCSECFGWATSEAWNIAWNDELRRRERDPECADQDEWGEHRGLDDRMVCPRCLFVHSDNECSSVDEQLVQVAAPAGLPE